LVLDVTTHVNRPFERKSAIEAVRLLNDLWWDILAGDGTFQVLEEHRIPIQSENHLIGVHRMIFFHLAMVLCKLAEFHQHYSRYCLPNAARGCATSTPT
jgi:hypothetical protein